MKFEELPGKEQVIAGRMARKGYRYAIQFEVKSLYAKDWKPFGEPLYFKRSEAVGPFMRSASSAASQLRQVWVVILPENLGKVAA